MPISISRKGFNYFKTKGKLKKSQRMAKGKLKESPTIIQQKPDSSNEGEYRH